MLETRKCRLCGKEFTPRVKSQWYCKDTHYGVCENCGKKFVIADVHYPARTCSSKCRQQLRKQHAEATSLKKYGVKNAGGTAESLAKVNATCKERYGVEWTGQAAIQKQHVQDTWANNGGNPMQRIECREKAKATCQAKYGADNPLSKDSSVREYALQQAELKYGTRDPGNLPEFREKAKQTCREKYGVDYYTQKEGWYDEYKAAMLNKYGVDHPMHHPDLVAKQHMTIFSHYGVEIPSQHPDIVQKMSDTNMTKYGVPFFCMHPRCKEAQGAQPSRIAVHFNEILKSVCNVTTSYEFRVERSDFDIRIDNTNILIEIDPTYTHTTVDIAKFGHVDKDYHKHKSELAKKHGYRCIHVFDWDDPNKLANLFVPKTKIYARQCTLKDLNIDTTSSFLDTYHLQGTCKGQDYRYGLFYNDELVEVMTFGKPRYNKQCQFELLRLCTRSDTVVIGGAAKLFTAFVSKVSPESIVSYCDKSKFNGDVYSDLDFKLVDEGSPSIHWSKGTKHITDNLLRQRGYDQLFGTNYGKGVSNEQLMIDNGWLPVYDCGQARFEWRPKVNERDI